MVGLIKFFKIVLAFVLAPLVVAFCLQAFFSLTGNVAWQDLTWMLVGLVGYFIVYIVINSNNLRFLETLEHEFIHAVTVIFSLSTLVRLRVYPEKNESGEGFSSTEYNNFEGMVNWSPSGCFLIFLAPYFLPILTIPLLLIHPFVPLSLTPFIDVLIGVTMGFHYAALAKEFHLEQTDIQKQTLPFSVVITLLFNTIILVLVISVVADDLRLTLDYLREAFARSYGYYSVIAAWIGDLGILAKVQQLVTLLSA